MRAALICTTLGAFGLITACGPIRVPGSSSNASPTVEEPAPVEAVSPPDEIAIEEPSLTNSRAAIDWESARRDFASGSTSDNEDAFTTAGGSGAPPVPVLLPDMPVTAASAGDGSGVQFRPMADGYFAVYPGEAYDIIINGTDRLVAVPGRGTVATDTDLRFETTMTGAQIAFSRYGASYLVEFACKDAAAISEAGCIEEVDAKAVVEDLLLAGTR